MNERRRPRAPWFARFTFVLVLVALYLPLFCVLFKAFSDSMGGFTTNWFSAVFQDSALIQALVNSLIVGLGASAIATVFGTCAALALWKGGFMGRRVLQGLSYTSLILPEIVFALALLAWFSLLKLTLGLVTVTLAHVTFSLSYVILTVGARLATVDRSLEDAARDLGASEWGVIGKVILPLLTPSLMGAYLLSFLLSFDDFLITFFVNGVGSDTLPVKLYASLKTGLTPKLNAMAALMWLGSGLILALAFRSAAFRDVLKAGESGPATTDAPEEIP